MRAQRVSEEQVPEVIGELQDDLEAFYEHTYGDAAEAGRGEAELFQHPRGGLVAVRDHDARAWVAMAGWTDITQLGYVPEQMPAGDLTATVELKRLYVRSTHRGQGLAQLVETARIREMFRSGVRRALGETGHAQAASQKIHARPPYMRADPFGAFHREPGSLFYAVTPGSWAAYERSLGAR